MRRSLRSKIVKYGIRLSGAKSVQANLKKCRKFIKRQGKEHLKAYQVPFVYRFNKRIKRLDYRGMTCFEIEPIVLKNHKQLLFLNGGGYMIQPKNFHWTFLMKLSKQFQARIHIPLYPKAPDHQYEEGFEKVLYMYKELLKQHEAKELVLIGDSSGGGFTLAFCQFLKEKELPQPGQLILISPWLDITLSNPKIKEIEKGDPLLARDGLIEIGKYWAGKQNPHHYLLSPINGDLQGLAPMTLITGTEEIFYPDVLLLKRRAEREGIKLRYYEYPHMNHSFLYYPIPEANQAFQDILQVLEH